MSIFCANLNFLFTENNTTILDRFRLAKENGFRAIETSLPYDLNIEELIAVYKETGLKVAMLNINAGTVPNGQFGCACFPDNKEDFKENLKQTIKFANVLDCRKIHIYAGQLTEPVTQKHHDTYIENLKCAVSLFEEANIIGLIEPISAYSIPNYYLSVVSDAVKIVKQFNSPHLKMIFDVFHIQHLIGNLTTHVKELMPLIGHVQIAQVPSRNEPHSEGELNYEYLFKILLDVGYADWIGCEYKPKHNTILGLEWVDNFGLVL